MSGLPLCIKGARRSERPKSLTRGCMVLIPQYVAGFPSLATGPPKRTGSPASKGCPPVNLAGLLLEAAPTKVPLKTMARAAEVQGSATLPLLWENTITACRLIRDNALGKRGDDPADVI
jgi:hypothetical protein